MAVIWFLMLVFAAGLGGYAALRQLGLAPLESWAGARVAGLVIVTMPSWWLGVLGVTQWRSVGGVLLVIGAVVGAVVVWKDREHWRALLTAEAIFTVGLILVLFIRLDRPEIIGQEKPMDMGILASLLRTNGFPPPDMWLSGETLPYYYWGALIWTVPISAGVLPLEVAYNLILGVIGGLVLATLWVLGRRLAGGSHLGGLLAGFFGLFAGTPDGLRQWLGGTGLRSIDVWSSSRQHEDVITEFPLFTVWLGDLHPHLLSLPIACLAMMVAWRAGRDGPRISTTAALAVLFGVVWAANPWAMPPTLAAVALLVLTADGRWRWPMREGMWRWLSIVVVAAGGWLVTAPFHLSFTPFFEGIRPVHAWTAPLTLLLYGGCLLAPVVGAGLALVRETLGSDARGHALMLAGGAVVMMASMASHRPTMVVLAALLVILGLWLVARGERVERPAIALAALGVFLFLVPEILHVVDAYGDRLHRMNTVFKSYIQAWVFIALALPVLIGMCARRAWVRRCLIAVLVIAAIPHLAVTVLNQFSGRPLGIDGMAWLEPGDQAIIRHLRNQPIGTSLIETVGGAYSEYSRLSANSGIPAYLGWENHESVWRRGRLSEETGRRRALVDDLYRSGDPDRIHALVDRAGVDLVAIGALERRDFKPEALDAIVEAGTVELDQDGGILVRFGEPEKVEKWKR
jgi:YYY domain-containing protein